MVFITRRDKKMKTKLFTLPVVFCFYFLSDLSDDTSPLYKLSCNVLQDIF